MVGHLVTEDDERLLSGEQIKSMSAPQFTPGPWSLHRRVKDDCLVHANGYGVCDVRSEANAHLIAAAPELYEALVALRGYGCPVCNGDCASANPTVVGCPMQQASAALAKARGEVA